MNPGPVAPASLAFDADGTPFSPRYGDVYHPRSGALEQARHVFLGSNGLPERWRGRERFVVLETGFGLGNNFLATWDAWRTDPARCARLDFVSIENAPLAPPDLARAHAGSPLAALAAELGAAWPALTPDLHLLRFEGGRLRLLLALGDVAAWLPQIGARVDAFFLDGFAPAKNPQMWQPRLFKALGRLAAPGATAATWSAARSVRDGLASAGFEVTAAPGQGGKREITLARHAPRIARRALPIDPPAGSPREAVIVGAGLAGCAAAAALAEQGWSALLLDRHGTLAAEASGNPAGIFHGVVHGVDGAHARFYRAAAVEARHAVARAIAAHGVAGSVEGMLRLASAEDSRQRMQALLDRLGLPADCVRAVDTAQASILAGIPLPRPAWFHAAGGWVEPAGLARSFVERAGGAVVHRGGVAVERIERVADAWQLRDATGATIARAAHVVLANAIDARRLLGAAIVPLAAVRGQVSWTDAIGARPAPALALGGAGYLLPPLRGRVVFGATSDAGDADPDVRAADHARNLAQLAKLSAAWAGLDPSSLDGRVGWRCVARDRLPLIGAAPCAEGGGSRRDQPRFVERLPGLYVFTALGSRGITTAALGAELLAGWMTGATLPLEVDLRDALDPARFAVRRWRAQA